ncbi:tRNA 2-selenouridine(34) synthase MnmH [Prochlorococcus sp. MIT 1307]|uniref:tRNA 2-selenouridine(34) synthase MnmH n=1 Tax=Prochlorococcus sp. MIT 1307 TaxID=3096219 RepID=UPI002A766808|nr:tRNA 2-selenouridine(34) synthase MnmH [Prochlorococcus sp. MIT 1307]
MSGIGLQTYLPIETFRQINGPVIDIRSSSEFNKGHWPEAISLPLFSDEERATVGKSYKNEGREKAILLGLKFIGPKIPVLKGKLQSLSQQVGNTNNDGINKYCLKLYCWRGGMRSASVSWLANLLNLKPVILIGGYKAYRNWVLKQFQKELPLKLIGGKTGTGKTDLLYSMKKAGLFTIDLEGLANHRGSSFGSLGLPPQPTSELYENLLAETLENCKKNPAQYIWLEAESASLGRCRIPNELFKQMKKAPILEICRSQKERIQQLVKVYSNHDKDALIDAVTRISRRLGPQRTKEAKTAIENENWEQACVAMLDYYDRCYDYELARSPKRKTVDLTGKTADLAVEKLLREGLLN